MVRFIARRYRSLEVRELPGDNFKVERGWKTEVGGFGRQGFAVIGEWLRCL